MAEIIVEKPAGEPSEKTEQAPDVDALRAELEEQFQAKEQEWQNKFETLEKKYEENDLRWKQSMTQQGQELGRYRQLFEGMKQQEDKPKRSRRKNLPDEVDPIVNQEQFSQAWKASVERIEDLSERMETLNSQLGKLSEVDQLKADLKALQTQMFVSSEEQELRSKYGLSDRDVEKLKGFVSKAELPSLKSGLFYVPEIEEKVLASREKPVSKSKAGSGIGQDMLKATEQQTTARGGKKSDPNEGDWLMELEAALRPDGNFDSWPQDKKEQAKARLNSLNQNGGVSMFK